ncbi:hypothetical protein CGRA01v4_00878 [Colletotrichum graminicola]|nr:hypothetical protein CGRA01v4_00878 [Colletotrichum graminicola]
MLNNRLLTLTLTQVDPGEAGEAGEPRKSMVVTAISARTSIEAGDGIIHKLGNDGLIGCHREAID